MERHFYVMAGIVAALAMALALTLSLTASPETKAISENTHGEHERPISR